MNNKVTVRNVIIGAWFAFEIDLGICQIRRNTNSGQGLGDDIYPWGAMVLGIDAYWEMHFWEESFRTCVQQ